MADWLNQQGFRRTENRLFTRDNLRDILQNMYYAGKIRYPLIEPCQTIE